jgi:hypothetical protein
MTQENAESPQTPPPVDTRRSPRIIAALITLAGTVIAALLGSAGELRELFGFIPPTPIPTRIQEADTPAFSTPTAEPATPIPEPRISGFKACTSLCDGGRGEITFSEGIETIHLQWDYENLPTGSRYERIWRSDGREWIRYQCLWPGPESGTDQVQLTEPNGLGSGFWELTITIDGEVLLQEEIMIEGNWEFWDPAGVRNSCY